MPLSPGSRLGPYEVLALLGAGGMGEVYKAHDTRLNRSVAIKVLPAAFASDPDRLARFEREAESVAALSHPNILAIFDTGVQDTHAYVVTELLDGETLSERLQSGPLPVRRGIEIAVQIARGLAAAHAKGIVHRDLKPANVFILADGQVKILDFGLAKSIATDSDTTAAAATDPGSILGTAGYMAPEQVRGQAVDARTDLFAFGAVLYEMLTGQRAFKRDTAAETLTAILKEDPPEFTGTRLSPALERIVRHCLEKNPAERFQTARDVAFALETFSGSSASGTTPAATDVLVPARTRRRRMLLAAAMLAVGTALVAAGVVAGRRMNAASVSSPTFTTKTFQRQAVYHARFQPDDRTIVYSSPTQGAVPDLYVLRPDAVEPQRIAVGLGFYSVSTSGELAVQTQCGGGATGGILCTLERMSLGGAPRAVLEHVRDADWAADGSLAVIHYIGGKYRLEYPIGTTLYETTGGLGGSGFSIGGIRVSPDGSRVAFFEQVSQGDDRCSVRVVDRSAHVITLTRESVWSAGLAWTPDGTTVIFAASEVGSMELQLRAVKAAAGSPVRNLPQSAGGLQLTDVARNGAVLATRSDLGTSMWAMLAGASAERDVSWLNRSAAPLLSEDGAWVLFTDASAGPATLLRRTDGSPPQRLGEGAALGLSPDGKWALAQVSGAKLSHLVLYATGPGEPIVLPKGPIEQVTAGAWFPDGRRILVCGNEASHAPRCYVQDVAGGAPKPVTPEGVVGWVLSPDGRRLLAQAPDEVWQVIRLDGGAPATAHGLRPDDRVAGWSTDGRAALVTGTWPVPARLERVDLRPAHERLSRESHRQIARG